MQPPLTYSWIALTGASPVVLLLTAWTLGVFHCRRRQWSTIDIFLVSILSQSTVQQFLGFIYSTLVLLKLSSISTGDAVCTGMMWFFIAIPIFKGTTITSLAVDRWLCSKFSYRLSVRKNHIRYHIAVLAVLSCFIGFTALITFNNPELLTTTTHHPFGSSQYSFDQCTFLPFKFDLKFVVFYISVHLIIILIGMVALCKSMCHRNNNNAQLKQSQIKHNKRRRRRSLPLDLTPTLSNTSTASSSISTTSPSAFFSTPGLTARAVLSNNPPNNAYQIRNKMLLEFQDQNKKEEKKFYRLSTSVGLLVLSILCTHLPFTIATLLSRYDVLEPIQMGASDDQLSLLNWPVTNIILWFQVFEGLAILLVLLIVDNIVPGWIFNRSTQDKRDKAKRIPNLTHMQPGLNFQSVEVDMKNNHPNSAASIILNNRAHPKTYTNAGYSPDYKSSRFPITNGSLLTPTPLVTRSQTPKQDTRIGSDGFHRMLENATRNQRGSANNLDDFGNYAQTFQEDESEYDKKSYHQRYASVASVTTVANDDFEFHHSRPFYQHSVSPPNEFNQSTYVVPKTQQVVKKRVDAKKYQELETNSPHVPIIKVNPPPTSLSMNDLDLIDDTEFKYCDNSASKKPSTSVVGTHEYKQKRMYRKRSRMHTANVAKENNARHSPKVFDQPNQLPRRRVLSMECLSPQTIQTDYRNFFDISYLDTGDIMVRKADSSKCIFVTDFI